MTTVSVHVQTEDGNAEEIDRATRQPREVTRLLEVSDVRRADAKEPPAGAKGDASQVGTLVVELANSA